MRLGPARTNKCGAYCKGGARTDQAFATRLTLTSQRRALIILGF